MIDTETTTYTGNGPQITADPVAETPASYFDGNTWQLIGWRLLSFFVCVITLGIAYPWMLCVMQNWETKHTVIDGRRLKFDGQGHQLIGNYLLWLLLTVITLGIYGIWFGLGIKKWVVKHTLYADSAPAADGTPPVASRFSGGAGGFLGIHLLAFFLTVITLGIGKAWADVKVLRWEAKHTHIGGTTLVFGGTGGQLFVKYLLFVLLTPLTLGIYALFFPVSYKKWEIKSTNAVCDPLPPTPDGQPFAPTDAEKTEGDKLSKTALVCILCGAAVLVTLLAIAIAPLFVIDRPDRTLFGRNLFIPLSDAMETDFFAGDLVVVKPVDPETLSEGDIIAYVSWDDANIGQTVIHKIRSRSVDEDGTVRFVTYSTLTDADDNGTVLERQVIGKYEKRMPTAGKIYYFLGHIGLFSRKNDEQRYGKQFVQTVRSLPVERINGESYSFADTTGRTTTYVMGKDIYYDRDNDMLYFSFGTVEGNAKLYITDGNGWGTRSVAGSGVFKVYYPEGYAPNVLYVCEAEEGNFYDVTRRMQQHFPAADDEEAAQKWIGEETADTVKTTAKTTRTAPTERTAPTTKTTAAKKVLAERWRYAEIVNYRGEEHLSIYSIQFSADGTFWRNVITLDRLSPEQMTADSPYSIQEGTYWGVPGKGFEGINGTYLFEGDTLTLSVAADPYYGIEAETTSSTVREADGFVYFEGKKYCKGERSTLDLCRIYGIPYQ